MTPFDIRAARIARRLDRQFLAMGRSIPQIDVPLRAIRARRFYVLRVPVALLFVAAGIFSVLPFLGLWMLPVGLLLLAIDVPPLRAPTAALVIRLRRRIDIWRRRFRRV